MEKKPKFAVIGSGSWATAIMKILCETLDHVHWYIHKQETVNYINNEHHNPSYLKEVEFSPEQLLLSSDINEVVSKADHLIFVIPSVFFHRELAKLNLSLKNKTIYVAIKGIVPESGLIVTEHFHKFFDIPMENMGVISGPCHAEEVAIERLSYLTIAGYNQTKAQLLANILHNSYIRCNLTNDVIGTEYAAVLKNIYAIAAGIFHTLNYGDNFQSVLMSNAIREMDRFIANISHTERNIDESAYLGDLLVTGYSAFSRNRKLGDYIAKGYSVEEAQSDMNMIAEGYYATKSAFNLNNSLSEKADTPIIDAVYQVLYEQKDPKKTMFALTRKLN